MIRDAKFVDVEDVMDDMSQISYDEMEATGLCTRWWGLKRAKLCKDKGFLKVVTKQDKPMFIFGAAAIGTGHFRTWFMATESYFKAGPGAIKMTASAMEQIAKGYKNHLIEAATYSRDDKVMRWFKTLGFQFSRVEGDTFVFKYVGRRNSTKQPEYGNLPA